METIRTLESQVVSKRVVSDFLAELSPEEFEVLWGLTAEKPNNAEIAHLNDLSLSQVDTIRQKLSKKALSFLR